MTRSFLLILVLVILCHVTKADCPPVNVRFEEQVQASSVVARLAFTQDFFQQDLCAFDVEQPDGNPNNNSVVSIFQVLEVFKGGEVIAPSTSIAVLYATDTGYRLFPPSRLNETEGFVAFLGVDSVSCTDVSTGNSTMYPGNDLDDSANWVWDMNECLEHTSWASLSESEIDFLRGQSTVLPTLTPTISPTAKASTTTTSAPTTFNPSETSASSDFQASMMTLSLAIYFCCFVA